MSEKPIECDGDQDRALVFEQHRRRLLGVSYRILGSVADSEDVLQDAWLRWSTADTWCSSATAAAQPRLLLGRSMDATRWPGC